MSLFEVTEGFLSSIKPSVVCIPLNFQELLLKSTAYKKKKRGLIILKNSITREYCSFVSFLCVGQFWRQALMWLVLVKGS